jgi:hypothetical protein
MDVGTNLEIDVHKVLAGQGRASSGVHERDPGICNGLIKVIQPRDVDKSSDSYRK